MTKYILHGGAARRETEDNKKFFIEITEDLSDCASVLLVCFAKPKEEWTKIGEAVKKTFDLTVPGHTLHLELADEKIDTFIAQIKNSDAIYMVGGNSHILQSCLEKISDVANLLKNKTVAGSSAGALVLSKYFYENDNDTYNEGLGILPLKIFCHYTENKADKLEKLKNFGENLEILTIPEEKFFIIEQ